ncbi:DNA polymerase III subunit gamma/tau [Psychrobacillus sp. FSL H8-0484]|uniref:DNA polymerase III subunit gamma/tau n=1 Tax=Psychrobacillus sp. FSL H8-0484 TaxID=2921390 RepID=UPI0030F55003
MAQHLALYRKYRPTGFDSLIGQDAIKTTLLNALKTNKVSHAYLFSGPRGTGKTSSAKILAKALNCLQPNSLEPCGECDSCKDSNPDIVEMDAASNNGVDEIRELREKVIYAPVFGKYKVYIIDEVHMLTTQAFNALLKTLEEPPAHAVFILATTEPHKIPLTILSRCQRYDFRRISQQDIVERMNSIVAQEEAQIDDEALQLIAQIAAGGMRDALSLLDQAISHATGKVTLQDVINLTGAVDTRKIGKLIQFIANKDTEGALEHFNLCFQSGQEPKFFVEEMMIYYRDILLHQKLGKKATLKKGLTDGNFETIASNVESALIYHYLEVLQDTMGKLKFHHDAQLLVEMAVVQMSNDNSSDVHAEIALLKQAVKDLQQAVAQGVAIVPSIDKEVSIPLVEAEIAATVERLPSQEIQLPIEEKITVDEKVGKEEPIEIPSFTMTDLMQDLSSIPSFEELKEKSLSSEGTIAVVESSTEIVEEPHVKTEMEDQDNLVVSEKVDLETGPSNDSVVINDVNGFIDQSLNRPEDWTHWVDEHNIPPAIEDNENYELIEPVESTEQAVVLTEYEAEVLELLSACSKELRSEFMKVSNNISEMIKIERLSVHTLFREFKVLAVSDTNLIMSHPNPITVKLMNKITNKSRVESILEEQLRALQLVVVSDQEWERITNVIKQKNS